MVVLLSGGTGGAKLARGLLEAGEQLVVIANTGDDAEVYGIHVSPDPDLITYWLAGVIDDRGYGLRGDSWQVMDALEAAGHPTWFRLGDRDLAFCMMRTELMRAGRRKTDAHAAVVEALEVAARVLPMCDEHVATRVRVRGRELSFQEFMIVEGAQGPLEGLRLAGVDRAEPTREALAALAEAELIVIGPSNPVISIGPILAVPGMREAVAASPAPVVAVSPLVGGHALKGPTELFCEFAGIELSAAGIADAYTGLLDGLVADERVGKLPTLTTDTRMDAPGGRERVAREATAFARSLAAGTVESC